MRDEKPGDALMDGGLLQKQSKQVINMTMGTRTEVSNKDAGEEGGGFGWVGVGDCGGRWEKSCVLWRVVVVGGGAETPKWGKSARKEERTENL